VLFLNHLLCDRIGIIIDGKIRIVGTLNEILDQTQTKDLEDAFFTIFKAAKVEDGGVF